jgi:hypothetical protein
MPVVESSATVPVNVDTAFAISQTTGSIRKRWDPFIRSQHLLGGARTPAKGVRTLTIHRLGFRMVSEYVSFSAPTNVGMKMITGSWFFSRLGGGWRFTAIDDSHAHAVWRYNFVCKPKWLAPISERIGAAVLQRDIDNRIAGFARGCEDAIVVESVSRR